MPLPNPVIVVPGITASNLRDEYAVSPETVWSTLFKKSYGRTILHPEDIRFELLEPARVTADSVFKVAYGSLIGELRHNLSDRLDEPVPVYPFPYDWRQPLDIVESRLEAFVGEVVARTRLMRHYHRAGYGEAGKVNLVGHSMGGLVIAGYLQRLGGEAPVEKVATLGTPFRGSLEAPIKVVTGTASLGEDTAPDSREREAARLTPALYHLLTSYEGALVNDPELPEDLYNVGAWQPSVVDTLAEFIRLHGLRSGNKGQRTQWAQDLLGDMLNIAKAHRVRVEGLRLKQGQHGVSPDGWLCLVGVDATTRVRLQVRRLRGRPEFNLTGDDRKNLWGDNDPQKWVQTGDGTVPFLGAEPGFLERSRLVCLRPDDFGYWEVKDRALLKVAGFHAMLPNLNLAHRLIVSHFRGRPGRGIWGRPAPGVSKDEWLPPISGLTYKA
jgi:pimeloyl-ACP methyl ester carboxylesterase